MQRTGRKSTVVEITISNYSNPQSPFVVKVQANKNFGICNIIQGSRVARTVNDEKTGKKKNISVFVPVRRLDKVLSVFQGRQYNDAVVSESLKNVLTNTLNNHE